VFQKVQESKDSATAPETWNLRRPNRGVSEALRILSAFVLKACSYSAIRVFDIIAG
jgi:hypothetical protein